MSGYCVYKLGMSAWNVVNKKVMTVCPASRALSIVFTWILRTEIDVDVWTPYLSVAILGWLSLSNTRTLCQTLVRAFRWLSTPLSSDCFVLLFSEVMGMYFAASVLLLRVQLPEQYREDLQRIVGKVDAKSISHFHLHFDFWFIVSASGTLGMSFFEKWLAGTKD